MSPLPAEKIFLLEKASEVERFLKFQIKHLLIVLIFQIPI